VVRSATAATAFITEIENAKNQIARLPFAWPAHDHGTRRYLLRRFSFSVVYRVSETKIVVIAVSHAHRRPGYWNARLEEPPGPKSTPP
jgi:toxin ParE1/3/4